MASTYDLEKNKKTTTATTGTAMSAPVAEMPESTAGQAKTGGANSILGEYAKGYTPSNAVSQANDYLNSVISGKPGAYQSQYKQQLDDIYNQVMNRDKFTYDLNGDMLYQQYKDQYAGMGKNAMMDTIGQASAMTGGYGNSYAATAGNQAYQAYLQQLNNMVPELYNAALNRYNQEGADLQARYGMTADLENAAYGQYRDSMSDWSAERDYAANDFWNRYNTEYSQFNTNREMAYNQALAVIQTGNTPSADLLKLAGISSADAKKMAAYYKKKISSGGSGGSGGYSRSGYSSSGNTGSGSTTLSSTAIGLYNTIRSGEVSNTAALQSIDNYVSRKKITAAEGAEIKKKLGIG